MGYKSRRFAEFSNCSFQYDSLFLLLNKKIKKGNCNFLSTIDKLTFFTFTSSHLTVLTFFSELLYINSELWDINSRLWVRKPELWDIKWEKKLILYFTAFISRISDFITRSCVFISRNSDYILSYSNFITRNCKKKVRIVSQNYTITFFIFIQWRKWAFIWGWKAVFLQKMTKKIVFLSFIQAHSHQERYVRNNY